MLGAQAGVNSSSIPTSSKQRRIDRISLLFCQQDSTEVASNGGMGVSIVSYLEEEVAGNRSKFGTVWGFCGFLSAPRTAQSLVTPFGFEVVLSLGLIVQSVTASLCCTLTNV